MKLFAAGFITKDRGQAERWLKSHGLFPRLATNGRAFRATVCELGPSMRQSMDDSLNILYTVPASGWTPLTGIGATSEPT